MLEKDFLVSIIMPAYNCESFIEESINSVILQTYSNWELLILDDFSMDDTLKIAKKISRNNKRIRVISNQKNIGVSLTRNKGVKLSKGSYIAFLDSDDVWETNKLELQMDLILKLGAEFTFTGSSFIDKNGTFYKGIFNVPENINYKRLRFHNVISCSSVVLKKDFFKNMQMQYDEVNEDYLFWLRLLKTGVTAYAIDKPLLRYRILDNSRSRNKIKQIYKTYKVFRILKINFFSSLYFTLSHLLGSIKKYYNIYRA